MHGGGVIERTQVGSEPDYNEWVRIELVNGWNYCGFEVGFVERLWSE